MLFKKAGPDLPFVSEKGDFVPFCVENCYICYYFNKIKRNGGYVMKKKNVFLNGLGLSGLLVIVVSMRKEKGNFSVGRHLL